MLMQLFEESNYQKVKFEDTSLAVIDAISEMKRNENYTSRSLYLDKKLELYQKDYGLSITGSFLQNVDPTIGDLEDNLTYQRRMQAGLEWNILKNATQQNF